MLILLYDVSKSVDVHDVNSVDDDNSTVDVHGINKRVDVHDFNSIDDFNNNTNADVVNSIYDVNNSADVHHQFH